MIVLEKDKSVVVNPSGDFYSSVGNELADSKTFVSLCTDADCLVVSFCCESNPFVLENFYFNDNDSLFKQEVFEVFVSAGDGVPVNYLELEINPNDALFLGKIHNPSGVGGESKTLRMLGDDLSVVVHGVSVKKDSWSGFVKIPFDLIDRVSETVANGVYMINFFRVVANVQPVSRDWECSDGNSDFLCWKSTESPVKPNFHVAGSLSKLVVLPADA